MPHYSFKLVEDAPYQQDVVIWLDGKALARFKVTDKIIRGFIFTKLTDWLGENNAANIMNRGEEVILIRETPILYDFTRFTF